MAKKRARVVIKVGDIVKLKKQHDDAFAPGSLVTVSFTWPDKNLIRVAGPYLSGKLFMGIRSWCVKPKEVDFMARPKKVTKVTNA